MDLNEKSRTLFDIFAVFEDIIYFSLIKEKCKVKLNDLLKKNVYSMEDIYENEHRISQPLNIINSNVDYKDISKEDVTQEYKKLIQDNKRVPMILEQSSTFEKKGKTKSNSSTMVPTYHTNHGKNMKEKESSKTKKLRVKLICVFPKWKYLVAKTTVEDYHSLFGGVIDQISPLNYFTSILTSLEKEFHEETSGTLTLNFTKRKLIYKLPKFYMNKSETEEIPFTYVGTFCEMDTIFTLIYIPKLSIDVIELWNKQMRVSQENLLRSLFDGWKIELDKIFEVNRIYHRKLMNIKSQYTYIPKPIFNFICARLSDYHHMLEKVGMELMDEDLFFDNKIVWEWNTMNAQMIKNKVRDLFNKTGVQVN